MKLVGVLTSWFHDLDFIAEDLGYVTEDVRKLVWDSGMPGMKILEFAFDAHGDSDYLPHCIPYNATCYLGTHDNNTVMGWLKDIGKRDRDFAARYMHITEDEGWCWGMIRTGMATCADLFVVQMQDLLELDEKASAGAGREGPHEHPRHSHRQLALAHAARQGGQGACQKAAALHPHLSQRLSNFGFSAHLSHIKD